MHETPHSGSSQAVMIAITLAVAAYIVAAVAGWPQHGRDIAVAAAHHSANDKHDLHDAASALDPDHVENDHHGSGQEAHGEPASSAMAGSAASHSDHDGASSPPPLWMVTPFVLLLGAIAVFPLLPGVEHWWEENLHRFYVAGGLGLLTLVYYVLLHGGPVEGHWPAHHAVEPTGSGPQWMLTLTVLANALLAEYVPFIVLLFSLYTISGGIRIEGDLRAHPLTNTVFITVGGLLASFIGTTGAAMLLIRPLLETNSERKHVRHTVIFFIFVVCNCGGCLLPIGDPPLFLGYLKGVDFLWTFNLWAEWLAVNCALLAVYWAWDHFYCYPRETQPDIRFDETAVRPLRIRGLGVNGPLLLGVILAVALLDPSKSVPGTDWHAWLFMREIVQLGLIGLSLLLGSDGLRSANRFNYHAIIEVAALFVGIFLCMQPALQILHVAGPKMGIDSPAIFFWITGGLSSVLDNAPTYVVFFETARTVSSGSHLVAGVQPDLLKAISLGAVFMGAMTYIGNGPNFMVKAIAEKSGVRMPSFFGYVAYSASILLPILLVVEWLML